MYQDSDWLKKDLRKGKSGVNCRGLANAVVGFFPENISSGVHGINFWSLVCPSQPPKDQAKNNQAGDEEYETARVVQGALGKPSFIDIISEERQG